MLKKSIILSLLLLSACGSDHSSKEPESQKQTTPKKSTAFDAQLDSLEKAKNVEDSLNDAVKQRDKAMSDQGI